MTLRRRLIISFSIVVILPPVLFFIAFMIMGRYFSRETGILQQKEKYSTYSDGIDEFRYCAENLIEEIRADSEETPYILENDEYIREIAENAGQFDAFVIVCRDNKVVFASDSTVSEKFENLATDYAKEFDYREMDADFYVGDSNMLVHGYSFRYESGQQGYLFIGTNIAMLISREFLVGLGIMMFVILLFTAICLTRWLSSSIFEPIQELNVAMNNIRDGNLNYVLSPSERGEIGELRSSYEDMRLRLKESVEQDSERERQNRELISNITHDLKTPITSVKGYVEGLLDGIANTPEKQQKYLTTIYNKTNDMDRLINELTLYSKIDNDKVPYNFMRLNVTEYFDDCVEEIAIDLDASGIRLDYENLVPPDTLIIADPEQMRRVINNIISNSVKYMDKPQKQIAFRIIDLQDSIRIEIEDNGMGISSRDLPNIFERFYRADASRNSSKGGNGIGLSIVRKIVEEHGGYIWATSKEGKGTCMQFVIRKYYEPGEQSVEGDTKKRKRGII